MLCLDVLSAPVGDLCESIEHGVLDAASSRVILREHLQDDVLNGLLWLIGTGRCRLLGYPHYTIELRRTDNAAFPLSRFLVGGQSYGLLQGKVRRNPARTWGYCRVSQHAEAVVVSGPARSDQYGSSWSSTTRSYARAGADMIVSANSLPRPPERSGARGAWQAAEDPFRAGRSAIMLTAVNNVPRHQVLGCRLGTGQRLHGAGVRALQHVWDGAAVTRAAGRIAFGDVE